MSVTSDQISSGLVNFLKKEVVSQITDKSFRSIMSIITGFIDAKPELITQFLDNTIISTILNKDENNNYTIDDAIDIIEDSIDENGPFVIVIPGIKFISPDEKELTFSTDDFEKLRKYINNANTR